MSDKISMYSSPASGMQTAKPSHLAYSTTQPTSGGENIVSAAEQLPESNKNISISVKPAKNQLRTPQRGIPPAHKSPQKTDSAQIEILVDLQTC